MKIGNFIQFRSVNAVKSKDVDVADLSACEAPDNVKEILN
jgi:hypothetical protein